MTSHDIASIALRLVLGVFFLISGFHKIFNPQRRASLAATFKADGVYSPVTMNVIPLGELFGGAALVLGFLTPLACGGLIVICTGACILDGFKRIPNFQPLDKADYLADILYLPEVLFTVMLFALALLGAGPLSADSFLSATLSIPL